MELAGHKCVGFCEFDKFAVASYTSMHLITDDQRKYLETLPIKKRQKEILKEEYRNGEWYASDIREVHSEQLPESDCWLFGAPCQDFSVAGKRAGLGGDRSSLIREIFRLLEEQKEENRPEWLIYENVKGMLSSNKGLDYLSILSEMDRLGYDIEWQNINSRWWVPQNRERIYTIGHLRRFGSRKVLPVTGTDGENSLCLIGCIEGRNSQRDRVYSKYGNSSTISTCPGGNTEPKVGLCVDVSGNIEKEYNGIYVEMPEGFIVYAVWYEKENCYITIRKLTPKECFRLQGWTDDYFERAAFVNSDSQLYKQAGNGVTVLVVKEIAEKIKN